MGMGVDNIAQVSNDVAQRLVSRVVDHPVADPDRKRVGGVCVGQSRNYTEIFPGDDQDAGGVDLLMQLEEGVAPGEPGLTSLRERTQSTTVFLSGIWLAKLELVLRKLVCQKRGPLASVGPLIVRRWAGILVSSGAWSEVD